MDRRRLSTFFLPALLLLAAPVPGGDDLQGCFEGPSAEQLACIEQRLEPLGRVLDEAERTVPSHAAEVLHVLELAEQRHQATLSENGGLQARLLDLRGQALSRLGRHDEAADALVRSIELDEGTRLLRWVSPGPGPSWEQALDMGSGRIERAALGLIAAGRMDQARPIVERMLELGGHLPDDASMPTGRRSPLLVERWRRPLPELELPLIDGGVLGQEDLRDKVVVLDFWATWCIPCLDQLPNLQRLHESEAERGLLAVAINVDEPRYVVAPFVDDLGLTMPIGTYAPALHEAYGVTRLPALIVADRTGRVHARWDGHERGQEREVSLLVQRLLEGIEEPPVEAAKIVQGDGLLELDWLRELPSNIGGVALIPGATESKLLVSQGRALAAYRPDGRNGRQWRSTTSAGRLRLGPTGEKGGYVVVGFRPGAAQVAVFEMPGGKLQTYEMPSPILDAVVAEGGDATRVVVGTIDGLFALDHPEGEIDELGRFREVSAIEPVGRANDVRLAVLSLADESHRRVSWLSSGLETLETTDAPGDAWTLFSSPGNSPGIGVAPPQVTAAVTGRFLEGDAAQVAVATRGGQLVIVDLATGSLRYRARWDGISDLAAGDLDRDGRDELVVAAGNRLAVLSAPE